MAKPVKALEGLRVLELSQFIAGPVCGCVLADHGAEVIKVEPPAGEGARQIGPFQNGESLYFAVFNRNKKGITLDLARDEGRNLLLSLVATSDIVVENFRPGVLDRLGLAYQALAEVNPRVILVSVSGFGQQGPYRDLPAFDQIVQALSGVMYMNGGAGDPPIKLGLSIADYAAGFNGAMGAILAVLSRERSGRGQHVDVSLFDSLVFMLETAVAFYASTGRPPPRVGNGRPGSAPGGAYSCSNGWIYLAATGDAMWRRFTAAIGRPELAQDPRFESNRERVAHRAELEAVVEGWCAGLKVDEVLEAMREARVPAARVNSVAELMGDPQILAREMLVQLEHPVIGRHTVPGVPIKLSGSPGAVEMPAPSLGEHNALVYGSVLKLSGDEITRLQAAGII